MNVVGYRRLAGCLCVFGLLATPVTALAQGSPSWSLAGTMAFERGEVVATAMDGKIYVLTGMSPGNGSNGLGQEYDPATGNWRDLAIMPSVASHAGAVSVGGKIDVEVGVDQPLLERRSLERQIERLSHEAVRSIATAHPRH